MTCPNCNGQGLQHHTNRHTTRVIECNRCAGTGTIPDPPKAAK